MATSGARNEQSSDQSRMIGELRATFSHLTASLTSTNDAGAKAPLQRTIPLPVPAFVSALLGQQLVANRRATTTARMVTAGVLTGIATEIGLSSLREFHRRETSPSPLQPEAATKLVTSGPNAYTRNPMYLAMAMVLAAHALARRSWTSLIPLAGYLGVVEHFQIRAEEDALTVLFGEDYQHYCACVPRWVGLSSLRTNAAALASLLRSWR